MSTILRPLSAFLAVGLTLSAQVATVNNKNPKPQQEQLSLDEINAKADAAFKRYFTLPFERKVMNIQYSVLPGYRGKWRLPGNSELHFRLSMEDGFDGLKADMRLSKDGEIVLCHDEGYTYNADGRITRFDKNNYEAIHDMPLEKILALEFETPFKGEYLHPCKLDTMLEICRKTGAVAYLTLRPENWRADTAKRMAELVLAHKMEKRTIINLFVGNKWSVSSCTSCIPNLVYCNTRRGNEPLTRELIDSSATEGYQIICLYFTNQLESITPELVEYAASKGIRIWNWAVGNREKAEAAIARGVSGFQMCSRDVNNAVIAEILK